MDLSNPLVVGLEHLALGILMIALFLAGKQNGGPKF